MNVTEILLSLDVVSQVGINDKLITEGANFNIRTNTYMRAVTRWWYDEGRMKNYESLKLLFGSALNLAELLLLKSEVTSAMRVAGAIRPALRGVRNMSQTYRDDVDVYAKFNRLCRDVDDGIQRLVDVGLPSVLHDSESGPIASSQLPHHIPRMEPCGLCLCERTSIPLPTRTHGVWTRATVHTGKRTGVYVTSGEGAEADTVFSKDQPPQRLY